MTKTNDEESVINKYASLASYKEVLSRREDMTVLDQSGYIRVESRGGQRLYVSKTKTVRRVDVYGFEHGLGLLTTMSGNPHGKVIQQLMLGKGSENDISTFVAMLDYMATLAPFEKEKKKQTIPVTSSHTVGNVPERPQETKDQLEARKLLIIRVAAEKGVPVSPRSVASYN